MKNKSHQRGLVIAPAWVGDAILAQVLFKALQQQQPDLQLDVAAPTPLMPLFTRMREVSQVIELPFAHGQLRLGARMQLGKQLRGHHYDIAWVLPNSWKSALVPFFAGAKRRIGWRGEMRYGLLNDLRRLDKKQLPLMAERFLALAGLSCDEALSPEAISAHADQAFQQRYPTLLPTLHVSAAQQQASAQAVHYQGDDRPLMVLCPGAAYGWSKQWLPAYFAEVANHYLKRGFRVAILGAEADRTVAEAIMVATSQRCHNWVGQTRLWQAVDLVSLADVVVTNDSGLMHIACALDRPVVAIYGSSSPAFTPPLGHQVAICYLGIECSPCFARDCPLKHFRCMRELLPKRVIAAIDQLCLTDGVSP